MLYRVRTTSQCPMSNLCFISSTPAFWQFRRMTLHWGEGEICWPCHRCPVTHGISSGSQVQENIHYCRKSGGNQVQSHIGDGDRHCCLTRAQQGQLLHSLMKHQQSELEPPKKKTLAKKYLCVPATSSPSERVIGTSGNVVTWHQASLKPEAVTDLCFWHKTSRQRFLLIDTHIHSHSLDFCLCGFLTMLILFCFFKMICCYKHDQAEKVHFNLYTFEMSFSGILVECTFCCFELCFC